MKSVRSAGDGRWSVRVAAQVERLTFSLGRQKQPSVVGPIAMSFCTSVPACLTVLSCPSFSWPRSYADARYQRSYSASGFAAPFCVPMIGRSCWRDHGMAPTTPQALRSELQDGDWVAQSRTCQRRKRSKPQSSHIHAGCKRAEAIYPVVAE